MESKLHQTLVEFHLRCWFQNLAGLRLAWLGLAGSGCVYVAVLGLAGSGWAESGWVFLGLAGSVWVWLGLAESERILGNPSES